MRLRAPYNRRFEPRYPCREMPTRHCPVSYDNVCGDRPCARFESSDEAPWLADIDIGRDGP